jgi:hypothetical protein
MGYLFPDGVSVRVVTDVNGSESRYWWPMVQGRHGHRHLLAILHRRQSAWKGLLRHVWARVHDDPVDGDP